MAIRWETIEVDKHPMRIYMGVPSGKAKRPAILVAQHGAGVDGFVQDAVNRLFRAGYVAAAPELYHRQPSDIDPKLKGIPSLRDDEIEADMKATIAHLKKLADPAVGDIGIVGFCMGGRVSYLMAAAGGTDIKASCVFYGGNILKPWGKAPTPFERTKDIACPMIGFFGMEDTNPSPDDVNKIAAELARHGKHHEFHRYEGAGHAFQNFLDAGRYRSRPARGSWEEMLAFFEQHLA